MTNCAMVAWHPYRSGERGIPQAEGVYICPRCVKKLGAVEGVTVLPVEVVE